MDETRDPVGEAGPVGTLLAEEPEDDVEIDVTDDATEVPATHRVADGSEVSAIDARRAWAEAAVPILQGVAGTYNATITYAELAEQVQETSGIVTTQLMRYWIAKVLGLVTEAAGDEPMLAALCIRHDGSIGGGYAEAVGRARGTVPEDPEVHAAAERLACYQAFGATMPNGGGRPTLTPEVSARRDRARSARGEEAIPRTACPTCFMLLPHTGQCDECE